MGSHGAEFDGPLTGELADRRDRLAERLAPLVARVEGAWLETKPASVAVHVRPVQDRAAAALLLEEARAAVDSSLTLKPGKDVLEIAVTDAHKGAALRRLVDELGVAGSLYLGDDVTDEDGFRALAGPSTSPSRSGTGPTEARHRVSDTVGAVALLNRLADLLA